MKANSRQKCGRLVEASELAPAQETLASQGEIFSCGGVYVGLHREDTLPNPMKAKKEATAFWHLPNHQKEVLVLQKDKVSKATQPAAEPAAANFQAQEGFQTVDTIRRLFKESLN